MLGLLLQLKHMAEDTLIVNKPKKSNNVMKEDSE